MQTALHFPLLGHVHKCALIAYKLARRIANHGCRVQRNDFTSALPVFQSDLTGAEKSEIVELGALDGTVRRVMVEGCKLRSQNLFLAREAKHLRQGRIHFSDAVVSGGQIDAFPESLK